MTEDNHLEKIIGDDHLEKQKCEYSNNCPIKYLRKIICVDEQTIINCKTYNYYKRLEKIKNAKNK